MRSPWLVVAATVSSWSAESLGASTVSHHALGNSDGLVVSVAGGAPVVAVCIVTEDSAVRAAPPPLGLELARRGGSERHRRRDHLSVWCATAPSTELDFAIWLSAHLRSASPDADRPPVGEEDPLVDPVARARALSLEGISEAFRREPSAPRSVVAVAGDVPRAKVLALATRYLGAVSEPPARGAVPRLSWAPQQTSERLSVIDGAETTPWVHYGWLVPATNADAAAAFEVGFELLAGGDDARLPRLLTSRGLARHVVSWSSRETGGELRGIAVESTHQTSIDRLRRFVDGALKQLRLVGPSASEVSRATARLTRRSLEGRQSVDERAETLGVLEFIGGDATHSDDDLEALRAVTPERVRKAFYEGIVDARRSTVESYPKLWPADDPALSRHRLYTVADGDTLDVIAARFHVDPRLLARENDVDPRYRLMTGQPLWIPP